jgi:catechol 2,3-dioxygenase-like lactoylglutathione lyase family enzyme
MLDHVSFAVKNYEQSCKFYDETLLILGYKREITLEFPHVRLVAYGNGGARPCLWLSSGAEREGELIGKSQGLHIAFKALNIKSIDEWHAACLKLGGEDNGAPGPRAHYHPNYYGGFIIDPNGWRIEACFHSYQI